MNSTYHNTMTGWLTMFGSDDGPPIDAHCGNLANQSFCWDSAWAISGYCFGISFLFSLSQIATRHLMTNKSSTKVMMGGHKTYSVKRGRTRLIPEMLTFSFLFRGIWFFFKGAPGEPWACYSKDNYSFPESSHYGDWEYALREMFNRFATLMFVNKLPLEVILLYVHTCCCGIHIFFLTARCVHSSQTRSFSAFTILVIFWAGTSTIPKKHKVCFWLALWSRWATCESHSILSTSCNDRNKQQETRDWRISLARSRRKKPRIRKLSRQSRCKLDSFVC